MRFRIVGTGYEEMPRTFNPEKGTVHKAIVNCPVCGLTIDSNTLKSLFKIGKVGQKQTAVVFQIEGVPGKKYREITPEDVAVYKKSEKYLEEKRRNLWKEFGIDPIPDEPTPEGKGRGAERAFSLRNYNMNSWGDLFNSRQKLALITFMAKLKEAHARMKKTYVSEEYSKALTS